MWVVAVDETWWPPLLAALAASGLTFLGTFGLQRLAERRAAQHALTNRRRQAYADLVTGALDFVMFIGILRAAAKIRSGIGEGLDVATRTRKPVEPFDIMDRMRSAMKPVNDAVNEVWIVGTPAAIALANRLQREVTTVLDKGSALGTGRSKAATFFKGIAWSPEEERVINDAIIAVGETRREIAQLARLELGLDAADLKAGVDEGEAKT